MEKFSKQQASVSMIRLATLGTILMLAWISGSAWAETYVVTTVDDTVPGDGTCSESCSLRQAIATADLDPEPDTILLPPAVNPITRPLLALLFGPLEISTDITIVGRDNTGTIVSSQFFISGNGLSRVFVVNSSASLRLERVGVIDGVAEFGAGINNFGSCVLINSDIARNFASRANNLGDGGAIFNHATGTIELINSRVSENGADFGAGIYNQGGRVILRGSTFLLNSAMGNANSSGGAIRNWQGGRVEIYDSFFANNSAFAAGGALRNIAPANALIVRSKFAREKAGRGGAISSSGDLVVLNTTIDRAEGSSVIDIEAGTSSLRHIAVTRPNRSDFATTSSISFAAAATINLTSSWLHSDAIEVLPCSGPPSATFNSITSYSPQPNSACPLRQAGENSVLPPVSNRAPMTLPVGSPLVDTGARNFCPSLDQRGFPRSVDGDFDGEADCDVGPYELGARLSEEMFSDGFEVI